MKKLIASLAVAACLVCTGCLGPNNLHNSVRNWNAEVSDQDWLKEGLFLGLHIIPVYQFAYLGDILVCNTVDYWSGENPVSDPGAFPAESFTGKD